MLKLTTIALATLALAACAGDDDDTSTAAQSVTGCPKWGCGENSPVMGPYSFWEGNTSGLANQQNVRFVDFQIGVKHYKPQILNGSQLVAYDPITDTYVTGAGLTNGYFNVSTPTGWYKIIISHVNPKPISGVYFWVGPAHAIETYELTYTGPGATSDRLCANPPNGRDAGEAPGHLWKAPLEAILFTGDRYDADRMIVTQSSYTTTAGWFNIACAGSALAKLHLNRHTTAGSTAGYTTSAAQRQTLLKMYVSDVCGTGTTWTQAGTPLHWQNVQGWTQLNGLEFAYESRWNANGAICMDTHRLGDKYVNPVDPLAPRISDECVPPPCNGNVAAPVFPFGTYIVSAVPFDPF